MAPPPVDATTEGTKEEMKNTKKIGLGQCLDDGDPRRRRRDDAPAQHTGRQTGLPDTVDDHVGDRAGTVTEIEFFADPDAPHRRGVKALVAVDDDDATDVGDGFDVEQRATHGACAIDR